MATTPPTVTDPQPTNTSLPAKKPSWLRRLLGVLLIVVVTLLVLGLILFGVMFWFWQQGAYMVSQVYGGPLPQSVMPVMGIEDDSHRHRLAVVAVPDQKLMLLMVQMVPAPVKTDKTKSEANTLETPNSLTKQDFTALLSQWSNDTTMDPTLAMYLKQAQSSSGLQVIKLGNTTLPAVSLSSLSMDVNATGAVPASDAMDSLITILPASGTYPETLVLGLNAQGKMTPEMMSQLLAPMPRFKP